MKPLVCSERVWGFLILSILLDGIEQALEDIAYGRNLGGDMAMGSRHMSEKYGGKEFAIQIKGLELAAYDPRGSFGQGLSYPPDKTVFYDG